MKEISSILEAQLPEFIKADHPRFVAFLEAYYEFCEQQDQITYVGRNNWDDIDETLPAFLEFFYKDYLPLFPEHVLSDKTLLAKNAKMFYRAKGTEKSFKLLFRALFNEDVDIYYPKNDILKVSAGNWIIAVSLRIIPDNISQFELFKNLVVRGVTSRASALVDNVKVYSAFGTTIYEMFLSNLVGDFQSSEQIYADYVNDNGETIRLTGSTSGIVSNLRIIAGGANNNLGDIIPITGGGGLGASAFVSEVTTGQVLGIDILSPGAGFRVNDQIVFRNAPGDSGSQAAAYVQDIETINRQHPDTIYLNSDIIGAFSNVTLNTATFSANVSGRVSVKANSNVVTGSAGPLFLSEVGPNVAIRINGNTRTIVSVTNNSHMTVNSAFQPTVISNANGEILTAFAASNVNSVIYNALSWNIPYGSSGPIRRIRIINQGTNYKSVPKANVSGYIPIKNLGIIGRVGIASGGTSYAVGDELTFNTVAGLGRGAAGYVSSIASNGSITGITLAYPKIAGWGNIASNSSDVLIGTGTLFTTELVANDVIVISGEERTVINVANDTWLHTNSAFSNSSANVRIGKKADFIGGVLYSTNTPPLVTVSSVSGTDANLFISATMASGDILVTETLAGEITGVTLTNPGFGYTSNVTIDMTNNGDGTAIISGDVIAGAYRYPGRYADDSNLLNSASRIQDRDYYQNFSYVLKSKLSFDKYAEALKALVHPVGMKVFAQTEIGSSHEVSQTPSFYIMRQNTIVANAQSYFDAILAQGTQISFSQRGLINDYIIDLQNAGIWDTLDDVWLFVTESPTLALTSLKRHAISNTMNSPMFIVNGGYQFNGSNNYINTTFIPSTMATKATITGMRFGIYERVMNSAGGFAAGAVTNSENRIIVRPTIGTANAIVALSCSNVNIPISDALPGYLSFSRTGVTPVYEAWKNGLSMGTFVPSANSSSLTTRPFYVGGYNSTSSSVTSPRQSVIAQMSFGGYLTSAQELQDYNAIQKYLTALGANA